MRGKWFFIAVTGLLGILTSLRSNEVGLVLFLLFLLFQKIVRRTTKKEIFLFCLVFTLFCFRGEIEKSWGKSKITGHEEAFTIEIIEPIKMDGDRLTIRAKEIKIKEKLLTTYALKSEEEKNYLFNNLSVGAVCKVTGNLEEAGTPTNENAFNYRDYLRTQNIYWILELQKLKMDDCKKSINLISSLKKLREEGIKYIDNNFPAEMSPLASALVFGDRSLIEDDLLHAYQRLGIVHLLAISGLHVSMLVGTLFYLGLRVGITREKLMNGLLLFLPIYMVLTGASPSVNRACLMLLLFLLIKKFKPQQTAIGLDVISFVFVFYIFLTPKSIYNIGFQLSFTVTFALVLSSTIILKHYSSPVKLLIATSIVSQVSSTPILLYYFYEFSIVSLVTNVVFIPLFSNIILPAFLLVLIFYLIFGEALNPILLLLNAFIHFINAVTMKIAEFPLSTVTLGRPAPILMALYISSIPLFFMKWEKRQKSVARLLVVPVSLFLIQFSTTTYSPKGVITMIDVGQGDSILIKLPYNKGTYLIDTGGTLQFSQEKWKKKKDPFDIGKDVVVPFLKSKGITKLDKLILTHGDMDHMGGAPALLKAIKVKEIVLPDVQESSTLEKDIVDIAHQKNIPVKFVRNGDMWTAGDYVFHILSPVVSSDLERNDNSVALFVEMGGLKWLFTGDLEEEGEKRLILNYPNLVVDVLKVGHHGSKTSTSENLVQSYKPKVAMISAGKNNRFGHPHKEVLERLSKEKIIIYRTDESGAISYYFKGNSGTFLTINP
ncbi:DNA internalization-related competence protein ComEC/Rec2 [Cytobacillus sp. FJAT-54145]|uniref:DNA internalization-related competence protein ComEC/Rec2 n=1 Tax=Cytobacillus spartinae TaxID=3299023 RepID=A0ABW6KK54_9BACI